MLKFISRLLGRSKKLDLPRFNYEVEEIVKNNEEYLTDEEKFKRHPDRKTELYMWRSNVLPGIKKRNYSYRFTFPQNPVKITYFDNLNPKQIFTGPRHFAVITENGDLYTFGSGFRGVLGHGNFLDVPFRQPKLVKYFSENRIKVKKVVLGEYHSIALSEDGDLYSWGYGGKIRGFFSFYKEIGYIGHKSVGHKLIPTLMENFKNKGIKIKDVACGLRSSMALAENGDLYIWGRGIYGLNADGKNISVREPKINKFFQSIKISDDINEIIKIDCADEFSGALTKGGKLYVWGKNDRGQLGTGTGIGIDYAESEKFPLTVANNKSYFIKDFTCGENTMIFKDNLGKYYKTGVKIDYTPSLIEISRKVKEKFYFCGNSFYCMVSENNEIYQWGNLFKNKKTDKIVLDMFLINSSELFEGKEIESMFCKYNVAGAIVKVKKPTIIEKNDGIDEGNGDIKKKSEESMN